jgi:hypothetical protein
MVIAGVSMSNPFMPSMFYAHMNAAESPVKHIRFRTLGDNMFMIWCFCLAYWKKVTEGGTRLFQNDGMIIKPYDGLLAPKLVGRNHIMILGQNSQALGRV